MKSKIYLALAFLFCSAVAIGQTITYSDAFQTTPVTLTKDAALFNGRVSYTGTGSNNDATYTYHIHWCTNYVNAGFGAWILGADEDMSADCAHNAYWINETNVMAPPPASSGNQWIDISSGASGVLSLSGSGTYGPSTVTTTTATTIGSYYATFGGNVVGDGGNSVTDRGIVYGTSANPTTSNTQTSIGTGTGVFSQTISGLAPATTYHYRAYSTTTLGTSYGADMALTTLTPVVTVSGSISALNTVYGTASGSLSVNVSGTNMAGAITATAATGYEVSTSATTGFGPSVTVGAAGTIASTAVYVRLAATANAGNSTGTITVATISALGATAHTVSISSAMVAQRTITVTANSQTQTYGNALPTLSYAITLGALQNSDSFTGSLSVTGGTLSVGSYTINQGTLTLGNNYALTYVSANLTVTQRPVTITATAASKVYGSTDPAFAYTITSGSLVGSDAFSGALARVAGEATGTYAINQGTLALSGNYTLGYTGANFTITKKTITVTAIAQSKTYGATDPALTYSNTALISGDAFTGALTRVAGETVGSYAINQGTLALSSNYTLTYTGASLTINKAPLTVTAANQSVLYEQAIPTLTFGYSGFVNGDGVSAITTAPTISTTATASSPVGSYPITVSGGSATNYSFSYNSGTLTVQPHVNDNLANISISSGTLSPAFSTSTLSYTAALSGGVTSITLTPTVSDATATVTVNGTAVTSGSASGNIYLSGGANNIAVVVTAQDGVTKNTYTVTVNVNNSPAIAYSGPYSFTVATAIAAITPTSTATAVPATIIGKTTTFAGTGSAGSVNGSTPLLSTFNNPFNIAFDASGNLYITCNGDGTIREITPGGVVSTFASGLSTPMGIAIDASNNIYVVERLAWCVTKITQGGTKTTVAGTRGSHGYADGNATTALFDDIFGLAYDGAANLYIADGYGQLVRKLNLTTSQVSTVAGTPGVGGNINGAAVGTAKFNYPEGLALDPTKTILYVADQGNNEIRAINLSTNTVNTLAGSTTGGSADGTGAAASFTNALVVATDAAGMIYVGDENHRIRKITPAGVVTTLAGNNTSASIDGTGTAASFYGPNGLAFNSAGDLYVADYYANNIRKLEVYGYAMTPALPAGLSFDGTTGAISGTPTAYAAAANYTVTGYNSYGSNSAAVNIAVAKSSDATLSNLTASTGSLGFNGSTSLTEFVSNTTTGITVTPTANSQYATVTVQGQAVASGAASQNIPLTAGTNNIVVEVTAQDGTVNDYTVSIVEGAPDDDNLSSLSLSDGSLSPGFSGSNTEYTATVGYQDATIDITPTAVDGNAHIGIHAGSVDQENFSSGSQSQDLPLNVGSNDIYVQVASQFGTDSKTYHISVTRSPQTDVSLSNVSISSGTLIGGGGNYSAAVPYTATSVNITLPTTSPNATVAVVADVFNGQEISSSGNNTYNIPLKQAGGYINESGALITVLNIQVYADNGATVGNDSFAIQQTPNTDATLSGLSISSATLSPAFSSGTTNYTAATFSSSVNVTPVTNDPTATVSVNGTTVASGSPANVSLSVGDNSISVVVTAQDGVTTQTYTEVVSYQLPTDAALAGLGLSEGSLSPAFSAATTVYNAGSIPYSSSPMLVTPTTDDPNATVIVNGSPATSGQPFSVPLSAGTNTINVIVTAQDGLTTAQYSVSITEQAPDVTLSSLAISQGTLSPAFTAGTTSYTATTLSGSTDVTAITNDPAATVSVNGTPAGGSPVTVPLSAGDNTINVFVTGQDGATTQTYTLVITRPVSTDATLASLGLSAGTLSPSFSTGTNSYNAVVPYSASPLLLTPATNDPNATVTVNGNAVTPGSAAGVALAKGNNEINILVTAQDGTTTDSYVIFAREQAPDVTLAAVTSNLGTVAPPDQTTVAYTLTSNGLAQSATFTITPTDAAATVTVATAFDNAAVSGSGNVFTVNFNSGNTINTPGDNLTRLYITVTGADGTTQVTYTLNINQLPSTDATLSNLAISAGTLSPAFASGSTSYYVSVPYSSSFINLTPTTNNLNATVTVNGTAVLSGSTVATNLAEGANSVPVIVTAQDGQTQKEYQLQINRGQADASLASITSAAGAVTAPGGGTPYYVLAVNPLMPSVSFTVNPTDPAATVAVSTINDNATVPGSGDVFTVTTNPANSSLKYVNGVLFYVTPVYVTITGADGVSNSAAQLNINQATSSDATLSSLTSSAGAFNPVFNSSATNYTMTVDNSVSSISFTPTTNNANAVVNVNGVTVASSSASASLPLNAGTNNFYIIVYAQDQQTVLTYYVTVVRTPGLSSLAMSSGTLSPVFATATTGYTASVSNATSSVTITSTAGDAGDAVTENGQAGTNAVIALNAGLNTIPVVVTSQDGTASVTYTLSITRALSSDAGLTNLTVGNTTLSPTFATATGSYTASVTFATSAVAVTPYTDDANATVTVNGTTATSNLPANVSLVTGSNAIAVVVTAQDGTQQTYTVTVTRAADAALSSLALSSGPTSPVFAPGTTSYSQTVVNGVSSLTVTPVTDDPNATVMVNGVAVPSGNASASIGLNVGQNTITTQVTSADGTAVNYYYVTVTRSPSTDVTLAGIGISAGTLSPAFNTATSNYTASVPYSVSSILFTPTTNNPSASVTVNGAAATSGSPVSISLTPGVNIITTVITAGSSSETYTTTINVSPTTPAISYTTPETYSTGTAIANLTPASTGGAVPQALYGQVSTLAGSGIPGSANGTGAAASFSAAYGTATDAQGNVYVADEVNQLIRKISPAGVTTTFAGSGKAGYTDGTGTAASFNFPTGVATDAQGNVYVADYSNHAIRKITAAGVVTTLAGSGTPGTTNGTGKAASFTGPNGVATDSQGNVYVTDQTASQVREISPAGVVTTLAGASVAGAANAIGASAGFNGPTGITTDAQGNVYVADANNNEIRKITQAGAVSTYAGSTVAGTANGTASSARFNHPAGVTIDAQGNLYVADYNNNEIRKITPSGAVSTIAGSTTAGSASGIGAAASFNLPKGIAADGQGNVYVVGSGDYLVRKITITGYGVSPVLPQGLTLAGTGTISGTPMAAAAAANYTVTAYNSTGSGQAVINITVNNPAAAPLISYTGPQTYVTGMAISILTPISVGGTVPSNLYGQVSTLAGSGTAGKTNGTGAAASFNNSYGAATDAQGNVYIADENNQVIRKITPAGVTTTFAGSGKAALTNGTGTAASFNFPTGVATDAQGNVYVADYSNHVIRKITSAGVVTTLAGSGTPGTANGTGTAASFMGPNGVATDAQGNVYVTDQTASQVREITSAGVVTTLAGSTAGSANGTGTAASFNGPTGITTDAQGNVYVADANNNEIRKITQTGVVTTYAGNTAAGTANGTATAARFNYPTGLTADAQGNVYVSDYNNNQVREITSSGIVSTIAGSTSAGSAGGVGTAASFNLPRGIAADALGNVYVADKGDYQIRKITATGYSISPALPAGLTMAATGAISGTPATATSAATYTVTAYNTLGNGQATISIAVNVALPVISYTGPQTYATGTTISPLVPTSTGGAVPSILYGQVSTLAGSGAAGAANGTGTAASFSKAFGTATDVQGNVYVADENNQLIRKITPAGVVTTLAGSGKVGLTNGTGTAASFNFPTGVATDAQGNVYVADYGNHVVRKITSSGVVTTFAGSGTSGTANGTGTSASFMGPNGVATDSQGNVYVTDQTASQVREISPAGVVTLLAGASVPGASNSTGALAGFNSPAGIATDAQGNVYVADAFNNEIRKITQAGAVTTYAGSTNSGAQDGTVISATFNYPTGVATDSQGNVYVADNGNNEIRVINPFGIVSTVAGSGTAGSSNGAGAAASFNSPRGITADGQGNVYVAGNGDYMIRKIAVTGYGISPALPQGLTLAATGIISGTTTATSAATSYTVTAYNTSGSGQATISIKVVSSDATLANLAISDGTLSPAFASATTGYTDAVNNATTSVTVTPVATDATATVTVNGTAVAPGTASASLPLTVGANAITTIVTASDGSTTATYTITVTRAVNGLNSVSLPGAGSDQTPLIASMGDEKVEANNILSPNGDGVNDIWVVKNIAFYPNNTVTVYDRTGKVVYTRKNYQNDWAGTYQGSVLNEGTYYYLVDLGNGSNLKGFITVVRDR